jgi:hypothetical protein
MSTEPTVLLGQQVFHLRLAYIIVLVVVRDGN